MPSHSAMVARKLDIDSDPCDDWSKDWNTKEHGGSDDTVETAALDGAD